MPVSREDTQPSDTAEQLVLLTEPRYEWWLSDRTRAVGLYGVARARATLAAAREARRTDTAEVAIARETREGLSIGERWVQLARKTDDVVHGRYDELVAAAAIESLSWLSADFDADFTNRLVGNPTKRGEIRERNLRRLMLVEAPMRDVCEIYESKEAAWDWIQMPMPTGGTLETRLATVPGYAPLRHELLYTYRQTVFHRDFQASLS